MGVKKAYQKFGDYVKDKVPKFKISGDGNDVHFMAWTIFINLPVGLELTGPVQRAFEDGKLKETPFFIIKILSINHLGVTEIQYSKQGRPKKTKFNVLKKNFSKFASEIIEPMEVILTWDRINEGHPLYEQSDFMKFFNNLSKT